MKEYFTPMWLGLNLLPLFRLQKPGVGATAGAKWEDGESTAVAGEPAFNPSSMGVYAYQFDFFFFFEILSVQEVFTHF